MLSLNFVFLVRVSVVLSFVGVFLLFKTADEKKLAMFDLVHNFPSAALCGLAPEGLGEGRDGYDRSDEGVVLKKIRTVTGGLLSSRS